MMSGSTVEEVCTTNRKSLVTKIASDLCECMEIAALVLTFVVTSSEVSQPTFVRVKINFHACADNLSTNDLQFTVRVHRVIVGVAISWASHHGSSRCGRCGGWDHSCACHQRFCFKKPFTK